MTGPKSKVPGPRLRPDHPDFWKLTEIVVQFDRDTKNDHEEYERILASAVDPKTLAYVATQRAMRVVGVTGVTTLSQITRQRTDIERLASVYVEGFLLGYRYRERHRTT